MGRETSLAGERGKLNKWKQTERKRKAKRISLSLSLSLSLSRGLGVCSFPLSPPRSGIFVWASSSVESNSFLKPDFGSVANRRVEKMDHDETGCQAPPEGPILCINNCGFFGSSATMNMCSKCHKDMMLKQEQTKLAASSIGNIVNGTSGSNGKEPVLAATVDVKVDSVKPKAISVQPSLASGSGASEEAKPKEGPNRCSTCKKRVGLTGFNCRCGDLFCSLHRYSDKHDCPYDYRTAARDAIAKANPVVKAEKLDKI